MEPRTFLFLISSITLSVILVEFLTGMLVFSPLSIFVLRTILLVILIAGAYFIFYRSRFKQPVETDKKNSSRSEENHYKMLQEMKTGYSLHEVIFDENGKAVDYRFLETNGEFEKQTGLYNVEGKLRSEIGVEIVQKWIDIYGRIAKTGIPEHIKYEAKVSGYYNDAYIFRMGNPDSRRVAVLLNDITPSKESEIIREHLLALVKNSRESIISVNLEGKIQTWNMGAENIYGYTAEEAIGKHVSILIPREKADEAMGITSRILKGENINNYESLCVCKDRRVIPVSITISPIKDDEGRIIGMSKISHDISERKKAEDALIESERRWSTTLASISEGVIATDHHGNITFINAEAECLTGWSWDEVISQPVQNIFRLLDEETLRPVDNHVEKAIKYGKVLHLNNHELLLRKDGRKIAVEESVAPIKAQDGRTTGIVVVFHDITKRKKAELQLKNYNADLERMVAERTYALNTAKEWAELADQQKTNFLMTMSHELRTPLNSILGFSSIILQGLAGPLTEEQRKQIEMVHMSGQKLLRLVNDILDMSRIEKGKMNIHYKNFNILETVEEVIESEMPFAQSKGIAMDMEKEEKEIGVESDPERIHQVILNLVHNALKFTEKGSVHIECRRDSEYAEIKITDTGVGIAKENLDRIFSSFVQLDNTLVKKNTGSGSGLGLTITKKLLDLLNGRIMVKSEIGVGSTFTVYLPLKSHELKAAE